MKLSAKQSRRTFLQRGATLGTAAALSKPTYYASASDRPPNVVFIICDQMRGDALSCMGNPNARTPHLDKLASSGVLMENGFCNNPVCVPSRMSLFSGLYPHQTGRTSNRPWGNPLLNFENTLMGRFANEGYRTGYIGKNHTYTKKAFSQIETVSLRAREPFRNYSRFVPPQWHCDTLWPEELCHPRKNTDDAIQFIERTKSSEPFFLHVSYFDPHPPYMAPAEFARHFDPNKMQMPETVSPSRLSDRLDRYAREMKLPAINDASFKETLRYYHASVEWGVDYQVGRIMEALEKRNLVDDTIVVFTSDHGDFMGDYHMVRKGMFLYNSLLHVPMIWSAPNRIARGLRSKNLAQNIDIFPTLLDLAGFNHFSELMGRSLKGVLQNSVNEDKKETIFTSAAYGNVEPVNDPSFDSTDESDVPLHTRVMEQGMEPTFKTKMIQTHEWKFILNENDPPELYRTEAGMAERENLASRSEYAQARKGLEKRLNEWWQW